MWNLARSPFRRDIRASVFQILWTGVGASWLTALVAASWLFRSDKVRRCITFSTAGVAESNGLLHAIKFGSTTAASPGGPRRDEDDASKRCRPSAGAESQHSSRDPRRPSVHGCNRFEPAQGGFGHTSPPSMRAVPVPLRPRHIPHVTALGASPIAVGIHLLCGRHGRRRMAAWTHWGCGVGRRGSRWIRGRLFHVPSRDRLR